MIWKKPFIKALFCCCMIVLIVVFTFYPAEAQNLSPLYGLLNPLDNPLTNPGYQVTLALTTDLYTPALTGPYQVGRMFYQLENPTMSDIYRTGYNREFMIRIHYPADVPVGAVPAPYVEGNLRLAMGLVYAGGNPSIFDLIHSHAYTNVPIAAAEATYPVVIYSHGKNSQPLLNTATLEDLASQGFIVVSIEHPYDAIVSVLDDGSVLMPPVAPKNAMIQTLEVAFSQLGLNVINTENALTLAAAAGDQTALGTLVQNDVQGRISDVIVTLSSLEQLNVLHPLLQGRLNLAQVGVFGHSYGAFTVALASQQDNRITASLFMDPTLPVVLDPNTPPLTQPSFYMKGGDIEFSGEQLTALQQLNCDNVSYLMQSILQAVPFSFLELDTAAHIAFISDVVLVQEYLVGLAQIYGGLPLIQMDPEQAVLLLNSYINAFFNQYLKGQPQTLLASSLYEFPVWYEAPPIWENPLCDVVIGPPPPPPPPPSAIPEPGTVVLFGLGLLGLLELIRRKRQK